MDTLATLITAGSSADTRELRRILSGMSLEDRLEYISRVGSGHLLVSRFRLADQVIAHGLVTVLQGRDVFRYAAASHDLSRESLRRITEERYGLSFGGELPMRGDVVVAGDGPLVQVDKASGAIVINPVADWSADQLIAHVLDHEVPVDPRDMPGLVREAA